MGKQNKKSTNLFSVSEFSSNIFNLFKLIFFISNDRSCEAKFICVRNFNLLNAKLNPIYPLLALLGAHHILHVSRQRVNLYFNIQF